MAAVCYAVSPEPAAMKCRARWPSAGAPCCDRLRIAESNEIRTDCRNSIWPMSPAEQSMSYRYHRPKYLIPGTSIRPAARTALLSGADGIRSFSVCPYCRARVNDVVYLPTTSDPRPLMVAVSDRSPGAGCAFSNKMSCDLSLPCCEDGRRVMHREDRDLRGTDLNRFRRILRSIFSIAYVSIFDLIYYLCAKSVAQRSERCKNKY